MPPPPPIRPPSGQGWFAEHRSKSWMPRSTSQDSFPERLIIHQLPSLKPLPKWNSVPHVNTPSSTMRLAYVEKAVAPPAPFRYESKPLFGGHEARFEMTPRSTSEASFRGVASERRRPCYPRTNSRPYGDDNVIATFSTTSASAYVSLPTKLYAAAHGVKRSD